MCHSSGLRQESRRGGQVTGRGSSERATAPRAPGWSTVLQAVVSARSCPTKEPRLVTTLQTPLAGERISEDGRFVDIRAGVQTLVDLTAREYVESDPLDLDYLSVRDG